MGTSKIDSSKTDFDVIVVGGGPAGATAANHLALSGVRVALLDRPGRIKPCGGAVPPRLVREFRIPESQICARAKCARMISPDNQQVDMPIDVNEGYVGMVNRDKFDEWLRTRASESGAKRIAGRFTTIDANRPGGDVCVTYKPIDSGTKTSGGKTSDGKTEPQNLTAKLVIGADGANSAVGKKTIRGADRIPYVAAYHEIVKTPCTSAMPNNIASNVGKFSTQTEATNNFDPERCDVYYQGRISPDFYGWVFPHGDETSIGVGSAVKGFSLRNATKQLRLSSGMSEAETVRREGAPIPLKALKRWDNGKNVILAGDAAGVVAPASGEGIYYAMRSGKLVAEAAVEMINSADVRCLRAARKQFMREHGKVFLVLGIMQKFWYSSDKRREKFVHICRDKDVQKLTWESYMNKKLTRKKPMAHVRIFFKDLAHLCGIASVPDSQSRNS